MIEEQMNEMAEAFLRWPLPDDVCADAVACKAGAPHRTGTNLLTAHQALAMIRFVCRPELTSMYADVERLRADHERLTAWIDDLQSGMYVNCVYCGHRYGPSETTPVSMSDALKAHVEQCPQHPMSALRAELAALRADAERLEWYFGPASKADWLDTFMTGVRENWTVDQWRAAIDAARGGEG